jgi:hypothetical protein
LEFEEEVEVGFEEMNDAKSGDFWVTGVLFDHDIHGVAPPVEHDAFVKN